MKDLLKKVKKDFYNISSAKNYLIALVFLIGFLYFQTKIGSFIEDYLMSKPDYDSKLLDILIFGGCVIIIVFFYKKLVKKKYLPSTSEYFIVCTLLSILIYNRLNLNHQDWILHNFIKTDYINVKHIDLIITLLSLYLLFNFIRYIIKLNKPNGIDLSNNQLLNDDPIYDIDDDELEYNNVVDKLNHILLEEKHKKAISIGLIGPWGNGKSSVINLVEKKIKKHKSYIDNDIIAIHFLPYLNHNDDDIINEFFITLSNELSNYNGKLSNELINYSQKLTDLYKEKNIFSFLENHISNFKNSSANELYVNINKMLVEIDKKIIVFIDDLDRLNQTEILQVLKLIRNTANFSNTIFVVAMDKEYVISRLKSSEDILNSKFIDKFFQLEIYLPEIKSQILKEYFILALTEKLNPGGTSDLSFKIKESIENPDNLFEDYISNFRDIKRTINQIVFDYPFTGGEINFKDFMNFIYFKLKFPQFIKILKEGKADFLDTDGKGFYTFKTKPTDKKDSNSIDILDLMRKVRYNKKINLEKYILHNESFIKDCINNENIIDCEDRLLFIKTLAFLFGNENQVNDVDSIKYENNFRMLMEQKIYTDLFKNSEFKELLITESKDLPRSIENLYHAKKIKQLVNRIEYFNSQDENSIKQIIKVIIILSEKRIDFGLYEISLLNLLEEFVNQFFIIAEKKEEQKKYTTWIEDEIFNNDNFLEETRLTLLGYLWKSGQINVKWNLSDDFIEKKTKILYKKYLAKFQEVLWNVNDYKSYGIYHDIKIINIEEINKIYKDFWKTNSIELLCAQTVDLDSFSNVNFKITDTVNEIFGSRNEFISFVQSHKDNNLTAVKEFLKLFNLLQIMNFSDSVIFEFKISGLMLEKIIYVKRQPGRDTYSQGENLRQVFIETNDTNLTSMILNDDSFDQDHPFRRFLHNKKDYIVVTFKKQEFEEKSLNFVKAIIKIYPKSLGFEFNENTINENLLVQMNYKTYLKVISIQPPKDSQEPNYEIH